MLNQGFKNQFNNQINQRFVHKLKKYNHTKHFDRSNAI